MKIFNVSLFFTSFIKNLVKNSFCPPLKMVKCPFRSSASHDQSTMIPPSHDLLLKMRSLNGAQVNHDVRSDQNV